jgi:hypothetical protein
MGDEYRVGLYETLTEYTSLDPKKILFLVIGFISICDIGCAVALNVLMDGPFQIDLVSTNFSTFFYNNTADCLFLAIFRCFALPLVAFCAVQNSVASRGCSSQSTQCKCFRCFYPSEPRDLLSGKSLEDDGQSRKSWDSHGEIGQPLLSPVDGDEKVRGRSLRSQWR